MPKLKIQWGDIVCEKNKKIHFLLAKIAHFRQLHQRQMRFKSKGIFSNKLLQLLVEKLYLKKE